MFVVEVVLECLWELCSWCELVLIVIDEVYNVCFV